MKNKSSISSICSSKQLDHSKSIVNPSNMKMPLKAMNKKGLSVQAKKDHTKTTFKESWKWEFSVKYSSEEIQSLKMGIIKNCLKLLFNLAKCIVSFLIQLL